MQNVGLRSLHTIYNTEGEPPKPHSGITAEKLQLIWFIGVNIEASREQDCILSQHVSPH